jgi:PEGA domain
VGAVAGAFAWTGRAVWRLATRTVTGVVLVLLAIALGLAAVIVGAVGAIKVALVVLAHSAAAIGRHLWNGTGVLLRGLGRAGSAATAAGARSGARSTVVAARASVIAARELRNGSGVLLRGIGRAGSAATAAAARSGARSTIVVAHATTIAGRQLRNGSSVLVRWLDRAGSAATAAAGRSGARSTVLAARATASSKVFLTNAASDISRLRVTVRWHARSARPIVGALSAAFVTQLGQSIRQLPPRGGQLQPRHGIAGLALVIAVLIAAVYGAPKRDRATKGAEAVTAATSPSSPPALASVAPAPPADAVVRTLKERSAALLAPSAPQRGRPAAKATTPAAADARQETAPAERSMLGTLLIASAPKGAKVTIDGVPRGVSPLSVSRLRAGNRMVRLELDGYRRWSWAVYVSPSRQTRLNVSLVPDSAPPASSAVTNTAAAAK